MNKLWTQILHGDPEMISQTTKCREMKYYPKTDILIITVIKNYPKQKEKL